MVFGDVLFRQQTAAHLALTVDSERIVLHDEVIERAVVYGLADVIVLKFGYLAAARANELYVRMLLEEEVVLAILLIHGLADALQYLGVYEGVNRVIDRRTTDTTLSSNQHQTRCGNRCRLIAAYLQHGIPLRCHPQVVPLGVRHQLRHQSVIWIDGYH